MGLYKYDFTWEKEAMEWFRGTVVKAGTTMLIDGIGETPLHKPAILDQLIE